MNIKKSLAGLVTGLALLGSIAAPSAMAQEVGTASVNVTDGGTFNAFFCVPDPSATVPVHTTTYGLTLQTAPTANTNGTATGNLAICYTDTQSYRGGFDTKIQASKFTNPYVTTSIPAINFTITFTSAVRQFQQTSNFPSLPRIGDIGYFVNEADPNGQGTGDTWNSNQTLDVARKVHFAYNGRGTVVSGGLVSTKLDIPSGTSAATYTSQLTLTIVPVSRP